MTEKNSIDEYLEEVIKRCEAASSGPWFNGKFTGRCKKNHAHSRDVCKYEYSKMEDEYFENHVSSGAVLNLEIIGVEDSCPILNRKNAEFIAAARTDVLRIARYAQKLRGVLKNYASLPDHGRHGPLGNGTTGDFLPFGYNPAEARNVLNLSLEDLDE